MAVASPVCHTYRYLPQGTTRNERSSSCECEGDGVDDSFVNMLQMELVLKEAGKRGN